MEEDIEILEQILSELDENGVVVLNFANGEAIKNLLTRYKQLEEENSKKSIQIRQLKSDIQDLENECIALHNLIDEEM